MSGLIIPLGNHKLTLELTVKEAMALSSGAHFRGNPRLVAEARQKVRQTLEGVLLPHNSRVQH